MILKLSKYTFECADSNVRVDQSIRRLLKKQRRKQKRHLI